MKVIPEVYNQEMAELGCCVKIIAKTVMFLSNALGLWPFNLEEREFRLFSKKSLVSLVKLVFLTIPVLIVPLILYYVGWTGQDFDTSDANEKYVALEETIIEDITFGLEYNLNFLIFILPFAFGSKVVTPVMKIRDIMNTNRNMSSFSKDSQSGMILPLIGFVLFTMGKLLDMTLTLTQKWELKGFSSMYPAIYLHITVYFMAHILLHFFLASYEYFFYHAFNDFRALAKMILDSKFAFSTKSLLQRAEDCVLVMEHIHQAFSFFLLVGFVDKGRHHRRKMLFNSLNFQLICCLR